MIARLTATSLRAERKAAPLSEPPWWRTRTSSSAQTVFTTAAPDAVTTNAVTSGATGSNALTTACQAATSAGTRMMRAST